MPPKLHTQVEANWSQGPLRPGRPDRSLGRSRGVGHPVGLSGFLHELVGRLHHLRKPCSLPILALRLASPAGHASASLRHSGTHTTRKWQPPR